MNTFGPNMFKLQLSKIVDNMYDPFFCVKSLVLQNDVFIGFCHMTRWMMYGGLLRIHFRTNQCTEIGKCGKYLVRA